MAERGGGNGGGGDGAGGEDAEEPDAASVAVNRARAAALARGARPSLRPGRQPGATSAAARRAAGAAAAAGSGAGGSARDPQTVSASIDRLVGERGWQVSVAVGGVIGRWDQVVGEQVAAHCTAETFDAGVLTVRAESTAWATQVRLLSATVMRRLDEELGEAVVERLVVRGPASPSWHKGRRTVSDGRGPRDTYG